LKYASKSYRVPYVLFEAILIICAYRCSFVLEEMESDLRGAGSLKLSPVETVKILLENEEDQRKR